MNLYEKFTAKPYLLLVIDTTLASDNPLRFKNNISERIQKLIIISEDKIKDEKLQYDINREAVKISALSSGNIAKYEFLTGEEILRSDESRIIEEAKFTYFSLQKDSEKEMKTLQEQGRKQVEALKVLKQEENQQDLKSTEGLFPKEMIPIKIKDESDEISGWEE